MSAILFVYNVHMSCKICF